MLKIAHGPGQGHARSVRRLSGSLSRQHPRWMAMLHAKTRGKVFSTPPLRPLEPSVASGSSRWALTVDRPYTAWYRVPTSEPSAKEWLSKKLSPAFWTASTPGAACSSAGRPLTPESASSADAMAAGIASSMPPASREAPSADFVARVLILVMEGPLRCQVVL